MRRRVALGALVAAVALVLIGGAAWAAFPPEVTLTTPVEGQVWKQPFSLDLRVIGTAETDEGDVVTRVVVTADSTDGAGRHYDAQAAVFDGDSSREDFDIAIYPDYNGAYAIKVIATGQECGILGCGRDSDGAAVVRNIVVTWPPVIPTGIKSSLAESVATISWNSNNAEGDLLGYILERAVGNGPFACAKTIARDTDDPEVYSTTDDLKDKPDGDYKYRVRAVRKTNQATPMPTCAKPGGEVSPGTPATAVSWDNPKPDPTTTTSAPKGTNTTGGTTDTTRRSASTSTGGRSPNRPNLSALGSLGVPSNLARPPGARPEDDPGFNELLPFGGGGAEEGVEGGLALPQGIADEEDDDSTTTTLLFVAAGLLATVLSAHVIWLKAQVDKMPLEALPPVEPVPQGPLGG